MQPCAKMSGPLWSAMPQRERCHPLYEETTLEGWRDGYIQMGINTHRSLQGEVQRDQVMGHSSLFSLFTFSIPSKLFSTMGTPLAGSSSPPSHPGSTSEKSPWGGNEGQVRVRGTTVTRSGWKNCLGEAGGGELSKWLDLHGRDLGNSGGSWTG